MSEEKRDYPEWLDQELFSGEGLSLSAAPGVVSCATEASISLMISFSFSTD